MVEYFAGFDHFSGTPDEKLDLQRRYFALWAWIYFSPFLCEQRTHAANNDGDVIQYQRVALVYGKANCGKTKLIKTFLRSMFPDDSRAPWMRRKDFAADPLRFLDQTAKRCPLFFDDIVSLHPTGYNFIKDENPPDSYEHPPLIITMNKKADGFPPDIMKRVFLIHTHTAFPDFKQTERRLQDDELRKLTTQITGHLYKAYLDRLLDRLNADPTPDDWLKLSTMILCDLFDSLSTTNLPDWATVQTRDEHQDRSYDYQRAKLDHLLRPAAQIAINADAKQGWWIEPSDGRLIVLTQTQHGKDHFDWDSQPSSIMDSVASTPGRTSLVVEQVQQFLPHWTPPQHGEPLALNQPASVPTDLPAPKKQRWFRRNRP